MVVSACNQHTSTQINVGTEVISKIVMELTNINEHNLNDFI